MSGGDDDPSWLYGYDAWTVPLVDSAALAMVG
jgi:salicylate hydroxylase/6-hydroxynicotinate 3-monooxygenase